MITQDELDGVKTILNMKEARILQLEQQLSAATARGMQYNAELCAEKDARIAGLEQALDFYSRVGSYYEERQNNKAAPAMLDLGDIARAALSGDFALAEARRTRRAAEAAAAAGGEGEQS